jgi:hypothetical protein
MDYEEIQRIATNLASFLKNDMSSLETELDELVCREKENEAAAINNDGYTSQLEYLIECGWSEEDLVDEINSM